MSRLIGNTPLLAIDYTIDGRNRRVFAKSENLNMTGSVKDRMALHIMRSVYERGAIEPGGLIVEATSGTRASPSPRSVGLWDIRSRSSCPTG